jgi:hypothetical protein
MRLNLIVFILLSFVDCFKKLPRLNRREILNMEKKKENLGLIFINSKNISHNFFMEEVSNYLQSNPLEEYNFGYLDIENDYRMLEYFKIKNVRDSGIIIYKFNNKNYYVGEGINHLNEVKDIFEQIKNNKLNWSSNSIIERIFYLITGKRYGKEAHSMFSFGICIISLLIYITVNIKARKFEREMLEKRLKEKNK